MIGEKSPLHSMTPRRFQNFRKIVRASAQFRHGFAGEPASYKLQTFIHYRTLLPRHSPLPKKGKSVTHVSGPICHLCLGSLIGLPDRRVLQDIQSK